jgi:rare lipoprotein A
MRLAVVFCAIAFGMDCDASAAEVGLASFYRAGGLTAAHRSLPMGSQVRVLNLDNGRSVVVSIVDRGPFIRGRVIDVSTLAAVTLGFRDAGLARVKIDPIPPGRPEIGPRPEQQGAPAPDETSPYSICRYGADRLEHLRSDSVGDGAAAPSRNALGCENLRLRLFPLAQSTGDLAPVIARTRVHLTGVEAAAAIPVSALAEMEAAAQIPVSAVAEVPEHAASPSRFASGCSAVESCERLERRSVTNPVLSFLARLRQMFD